MISIVMPTLNTIRKIKFNIKNNKINSIKKIYDL
jgi:hypothetical protein